MCWFTWVILGVWPVLAFLGVLIQWKVTAEGFSHTEGESANNIMRCPDYNAFYEQRVKCIDLNVNSVYYFTTEAIATNYKQEECQYRPLEKVYKYIDCSKNFN